MNGLATMKGYCNEGYTDGERNASAGPDLDFTFNTWLV